MYAGLTVYKALLSSTSTGPIKEKKSAQKRCVRHQHNQQKQQQHLYRYHHHYQRHYNIFSYSSQEIRGLDSGLGTKVVCVQTRALPLD